MARLELDFLPRPDWQRPIGLALALIGLAALVGALASFERDRAREAGLTRQITALEARLARTPARPTPRNRDAGEDESARLERALAWRWQPALDAVADSLNPRIALTRLEGEIERTRLVLTAEAHSLDDALGWVERLASQPAVRRAQPESHLKTTEDPEAPVRITVNLELVP